MGKERRVIPDGFAEAFPDTTTAKLMERFDLSERTVMRMARELGLYKSFEYRSVLAKQNRVNITSPSGEQHYKWKGGKTWKRFADPAYRAWRNSVLERDDYVCQACQRKCAKYEKGLAAHHIQPYAAFPELRFHLDNGLTLCRECHMKLHGRNYTPVAVLCACGCGTTIMNKDRYGRPRTYVNHHAPHTMSEAGKKKLSEERKGTNLNEEHKRKISEGLLRAEKRGRPKKKQI